MQSQISRHYRLKKRLNHDLAFLISLGNAKSSEMHSIKYAVKIAHFLDQAEIATDAIKRIYLNNKRKT